MPSLREMWGGCAGAAFDGVTDYEFASQLQGWEVSLGRLLRRLDEEEGYTGDLLADDEGCCAVCGGGTVVTLDTPPEEQVLLCDGCDAKVHLKCAGGITEIPEGDWFCATCCSERKGQAVEKGHPKRGVGVSSL